MSIGGGQAVVVGLGRQEGNGNAEGECVPGRGMEHSFAG